jgi:hypothetical protein
LKVLLAVVLALGGLVAAAPAASAAGAGTYHGGCGFDTNSQAALAGPDVYDGVIFVRTLTMDSYVPPLPAAATVTCSLRVDGVEPNPSAHLAVTGSGVEAGIQRTTFTARPEQIVEVCTTIHYLDLAGATDDAFCPQATTLQLPPQAVVDTLDTVFGTVNGILGAVTYLTTRPDPTLCPVLGAHAGTYGPVTVDGTGDVSGPDPLALGLNPVWDCPPYLNGDPQPPSSPTVVCPYAHVTGTAAYTPALAVTVGPHTEAFDLTATGCTLTPDVTEDYVFHLRGTANDACAGAYPATTGSGTITGTAPGGPLTGTYAVTKVGTRYWVRGRFTSSGRSRYVDLWLDQAGLCPAASSTLTGDGAVFT